MAQAQSLVRPGWLPKESQREALAGYLFILPTFLGYTAFIVGPILAAIGISFTKYDILTPATFVGLDNYIRLFSDPRLRTVYGNTIFFTVFAVTLNVGLGLLVSVNRKLRHLEDVFFSFQKTKMILARRIFTKKKTQPKRMTP